MNFKGDEGNESEVKIESSSYISEEDNRSGMQNAEKHIGISSADSASLNVLVRFGAFPESACEASRSIHRSIGAHLSPFRTFVRALL